MRMACLPLECSCQALVHECLARRPLIRSMLALDSRCQSVGFCSVQALCDRLLDAAAVLEPNLHHLEVKARTQTLGTERRLEGASYGSLHRCQLLPQSVSLLALYAHFELIAQWLSR
jgi:hypothetical protein